MRVLFASAEVDPFSKVGGLGDVAGALPKALSHVGLDVRIITPLYGSIERDRWGITPVRGASDLKIRVGSSVRRGSLWQATLPGSGVPVYFLAGPRFFDRPGIYQDPATRAAYPDEAERFAYFSRGLLQAAEAVDFRPDIIHLNDFHTALAAGYLRYSPERHQFFQGAKTVFTIHNLGYQGLYSDATGGAVGMPKEATAPLGPLEFHGKANFMKLGIVLSDAVTTVSPTYAREIQESPEFGMGLEGVLRSRSDSLTGILNGIDYEVWNPESDPLLAAPYSAQDLSGKAENRARLMQAFGWDAGGREPLVAMIGRLAAQKGWDLVLEAGRRMVKLGLRLVVLGTGDTTYETGLLSLTKRHPTKVGAALRFDESLAHLMEAGADVFLMPSRYEPCGLNQMISLRYGTIPVVRATGGLRDTIVEYNSAAGTGNGFVFRNHTPEAMLSAVARAVKLHRNRDAWSVLVHNAMQTDCSWKSSARKYVELYQVLIRQA